MLINKDGSAVGAPSGAQLNLKIVPPSSYFVRLTKSPGAILNSEAGPKGEGQESVVTRTYT